MAIAFGAVGVDLAAMALGTMGVDAEALALVGVVEVDAVALGAAVDSASVLVATTGWMLGVAGMLWRVWVTS